MIGYFIVAGIIGYTVYNIREHRKPVPRILPPHSNQVEDDWIELPVEDSMTFNRLATPLKKERTPDRRPMEIKPNPIQKEEDDSIIDITNQSYRIDYAPLSPKETKEPSLKVPHWSHKYIYSYSDIERATSAQKIFYYAYKARFLRNEKVDLEGNDNYAFILLFDLLDTYEASKNISKLQQQIERLGQFHPKTASYGANFMLKIQLSNSIGEQPNMSYYQDYDYWQLGNKYQSKLNLNKEEVALLNQLSTPTSNFCSIEQCFEVLLRLFLRLIEVLDRQYQEEGSTLKEQIELFGEIVAKKQFRYRKGSYNYKYVLSETLYKVYTYLFRYCENVLREAYQHKRRLSVDVDYNETVNAVFVAQISEKASAALQTLIPTIPAPTKATEIELYAQTTTRWKIKFSELKVAYAKNATTFVQEVLLLGELNKKNPSVEYLFFDAAKFIAKEDQTAAVNLYLHYIYYDLKSNKIAQKELPKTVQKKLFKTDEQRQDFEQLLHTFIKNQDLGKALAEVPRIWAIKRKKIQLDQSFIEEVQQQHAGTVDLLNEYLQDQEMEEEQPAITPPFDQISAPTVFPAPIKATDTRFLPELELNALQINTLELFYSNDFSLSEEKLITFAKTQSVFKNQLVESINEACYELLDDVLIEEDEETYTIDTDYFEQISI